MKNCNVWRVQINEFQFTALPLWTATEIGKYLFLPTTHVAFLRIAYLAPKSFR